MSERAFLSVRLLALDNFDEQKHCWSNKAPALFELQKQDQVVGSELTWDSDAHFQISSIALSELTDIWLEMDAESWTGHDRD